MTHLRTAFINRVWYKLVPDFGNNFVTQGKGDKEATIRAAITPDGKLAMLYIPATGREPREFTVDLRRMGGPVTASWFNPTTGKSRPVADVVLWNKESRIFRTPGDNGTNANDWLLILESQVK